ncbi:ThiJ/PfpI family protein [Penicillium alfredii]|uniref:ThiJ/PfpI family protein n=1 Tax=Penicillium alfredii TaxID=1506179 RepID=A0A9W9FQX4_9EURO|nr:ThiJ/PfpI family protein [Penicillium alfredii]KAJ5104405.1 ThiJ/PfpI family protein [Penicillium alfredii]
MSIASSNQHYKVGVLVFPGADILDFAGPMEVLSHVSHNRNPDRPDRMFDICTIARRSSILSAGSLTVAADLLLDEALAQIADFDILVVPGGFPAVLQPLTDNNAPELEIIRQFAALPPQTSQKQRVLFSVCTGAFLVGATGILSGITVTTHHQGLDALGKICAQAQGPEVPPVNIVHKRCVDGGYLKGGGVRIITAGGISSGLDATFHLVRLLANNETALFVARLMEYDWSESKV